MNLTAEKKEKLIRIALNVLLITGTILLVCTYLIYLLWCVGAWVYTPGIPDDIRTPGIVIMFLTQAALLLFRPRRYFFAAGIALLIVFSLLLATIKPTHDQIWAREYQQLPQIEWLDDQDTFKIHNIRNFYFRTTTDFDIQYIEDEFKLSRLKAIDFISVYWPQPCEEDIAHIMLRFRFNDDKVFLVSSETRRTGDGEFGAVNNLYKQSGKIYIVATEEDVLALRTNIRQPRERVYIYELDLTAEQREQILLDMILQINELHQNPEFYNTLTGNCFTELIPSLKVGMDLPMLHFSYLASGQAPQVFFDEGFLKKKEGETFQELKARSYLNPTMEKWDHTPGTYSKIVRKWDKENGK